MSAADGKSRYSIGRASRRHLVNVIGWSASASLFTFPKHTHNKLAPHRSVMYITDNRPSTSSRSGLGGRLKWPLEQARILAVEDEPRHQKVRRCRPCVKSTRWIS